MTGDQELVDRLGILEGQVRQSVTDHHETAVKFNNLGFRSVNEVQSWSVTHLSPTLPFGLFPDAYTILDCLNWTKQDQSKLLHSLEWSLKLKIECEAEAWAMMAYCKIPRLLHTDRGQFVKKGESHLKKLPSHAERVRIRWLWPKREVYKGLGISQTCLLPTNRWSIGGRIGVSFNSYALPLPDRRGLGMISSILLMKYLPPWPDNISSLMLMHGPSPPNYCIDTSLIYIPLEQGSSLPFKLVTTRPSTHTLVESVLHIWRDGRILQDEVLGSPSNFIWICQVSGKQQRWWSFGVSYSKMSAVESKLKDITSGMQTINTTAGLAQNWTVEVKKTVEGHQKQINKLENKWQHVDSDVSDNVWGPTISDTRSLWVQQGLLHLNYQESVVVLGEAFPPGGLCCNWMIGHPFCLLSDHEHNFLQQHPWWALVEHYFGESLVIFLGVICKPHTNQFRYNRM